MNYLSFCDALESSLQSKINPASVLHRQRIPKNNGVLLDGICITTPGESCSPVIYLDPLYQSCCSGASLEQLTDSILENLQESLPISDEMMNRITCFEQAKEFIVFRLISQASNEEFLSSVPWVPFLDMAVIFTILLQQYDDGQAAVIIKSHQVEDWNVTPEELFELSISNAPRLLPPVLNRLEDLLFGSPRPGLELLDQLSAMGTRLGESGFSPHCIMSNQPGSHGAACLLYPNLIKRFADCLGTDLLVLPSSIHEIILAPDLHSMSYDTIRQIICSINSTEVSADEILSDQLYLYNRQEDRFMIWKSLFGPDTPPPGGKWNPQ